MSLGSLKTERVLACLIQLSKNKLPVRQESNSGFGQCNIPEGDVKERRGQLKDFHKKIGGCGSSSNRVFSKRQRFRCSRVLNDSAAASKSQGSDILKQAPPRTLDEGNLARQRGF